jgi:hypothetical protein
MTVATQSGYTYTDGNNARVLHRGNRFQIDTITASSETTGYPAAAANVPNTVDRWRPSAAGAATLRYDLASAATGNVFAIAAHNLGTLGVTVTLQHDSNGDDTFTTIGSVAPTDDSPILFLFDGILSDRWRISLDDGEGAEIGVLQVGSVLVMQRPFYGGFSPTQMNRKTQVTGNLSGSGELLGRSKKRTVLTGSYAWSNLTNTWVRANLDGPNGFINAMEDEPFFIAWRPDVEQDCDFVMMGQPSQVPTAQGAIDFHSFSIDGEVHSYE